MAILGSNVDAIGTYRAADLAHAGVKWARVVALPAIDLVNYFHELHDHDIKILLAIVSESMHGMTWEQVVAEYSARYSDLVDAVVGGNEPDIESPSSWTLQPWQVNNLMAPLRGAFPNCTIVGPGLASGQPSWVAGLDLNLFDVMAIHPYGQGTPTYQSPYGFGGHVGLLIDGYKQYGKPVWITEWGAQANELGEDQAAEYVREMLTYLRDRDDVEVAMHFCWSSAMVPNFGLLRTDGSQSPSYDAFVSVSGGDIGWPVEPAPTLPEASPEFVLGFLKWASLEPTLIGSALKNENTVAPEWQIQPTSNGILSWVGGKGHAFVAHDGSIYRWQESWKKSKKIA